MSYLLDTNVISEMVRQTPHPAVMAWFEQHEHDPLFLSVITVGEIAQGIARLPESERRELLEYWLHEELLVVYADYILPLDRAVLLRWGRLSGELMARGRKMAVMDGLLAAQALEGALTLVTRNVDDFVETGVSLINPWNVV